MKEKWEATPQNDLIVRDNWPFVADPLRQEKNQKETSNDALGTGAPEI